MLELLGAEACADQRVGLADAIAPKLLREQVAVLKQDNVVLGLLHVHAPQMPSLCGNVCNAVLLADGREGRAHRASHGHGDGRASLPHRVSI